MNAWATIVDPGVTRSTGALKLADCSQAGPQGVNGSAADEKAAPARLNYSDPALLRAICSRPGCREDSLGNQVCFSQPAHVRCGRGS